MKLIKPNTLTLASASEDEDDHPEWDNATTYAIGDYVIWEGFIYVSSIDSNLGYDPSDEVQALEGARWILVSATNIRKFIDGQLGTQTTGTSPLVLEVTVDAFSNAIALFGLNMTDTTIEVIVDSEVIQSTTLETSPEPVSDWWSWYNAVFFNSIRRTVIENIFAPAGATIKLTIEGSSPALGMLVVGRQYVIGRTLISDQTKARRRTYTELTTDAFGVTTATKRAIARNVTYEVKAARSTFQSIENVLDAVDGVAVVTYEATLAPELVNFGFLLDIEVPSNMPANFIFPVTCQGVI
ncbi:hypothetical protein [Maritimibacter alexandrii]|uniref:hypothetical protein n=1 Tax=Maritimibacter alexandrii TaxID=2570355 RepID=UPI00110836A2|nr:hypothetical protein [Maritimibacter alexandrii]